jgi:transposase, IS5 family
MGCRMYRKNDQNQLTMEEFHLPFGNSLSAENRWVKMAKIMPWVLIEELYAKSFSETEGRPSIPARIAYGAIYIKEQENLTDERTVEYLAENPYAQYFVGLKEFRTEPLFDSSMMVHFRKRFSTEAIKQINESIYDRAHPRKKEPPTGGNEQPPSGENGNKGTMILDATVAPADIKYPTDLSLLNACREDTEKMIGKLWEYSDKRGHKTAYSRNKARRNYLKIAKQRKCKAKAMRKAIGEQLEYLAKNIEMLGNLLPAIGYDRITDMDLERLATICKVYRQQKEMYDFGKHECSDRIVSLRQPHVRCIMRGKAGRPYEFGQKLHFSVVNGFTFIEDQEWDNYNEGIRLIAAAERYRDRFGTYPAAILADTIYRNRENRKFCRDNGIRLSGPRLGRPRKDEQVADKAQAYKDSCERNMVESRNGISKRRYGLDLIMAYLPETSETEAALQVLVMNVAYLLHVLLRFIRSMLGYIFGVCTCLPASY